MTKQFSERRLDVKAFAEAAAEISGQEQLGKFTRLLAEAQGRGADVPVEWWATGEIRNPGHVNPEIWMHLEADATLSLLCQRCLNPVDMAVSVDRMFRFVADEEVASAEDDQSEEDLLALSPTFDLMELLEDELLMETPLAPRHEACPPVRLQVSDADFDEASTRQENPFAVLGKLKT